MHESTGNIQTEMGSRIESLRLILEHEQSRPVTNNEALDIGESLITFFEVLGAERSEESGYE